jgi:hypothetical protein
LQAHLANALKTDFMLVVADWHDMLQTPKGSFDLNRIGKR